MQYILCIFQRFVVVFVRVIPLYLNRDRFRRSRKTLEMLPCEAVMMKSLSRTGFDKQDI